MAKMVSESDVFIRMHKERSRFCLYCIRYRDCVARGKYCPPYYAGTVTYNSNHDGLHVRSRFWVYLADPVKAKKEFEEYYDTVLLPKFQEGFSIKDFCKKCHYRCKQTLDLPKHNFVNLEQVFEEYFKLLRKRVSTKVDKDNIANLNPERFGLSCCVALIIVNELIPCPLGAGPKTTNNNPEKH